MSDLSLSQQRTCATNYKHHRHVDSKLFGSYFLRFFILRAQYFICIISKQNCVEAS